MVLLVGQYSVGKTSFIRYLLGRDFPGIRIGPEPTTDRFHIVLHGAADREIPGNALSVHKDLPFTSLAKFGSGFLSRLQASQCDAPLLKHVTLVDSPGVLSGAKQRIGRQYDFTRVIEWFADRCDMILLLFDAHKLDISDEFKSAIEALRGHDDKIRVVLNKADKVSSQQLMRVYGAMMWSLGKVVRTPEVMRVYIGSFWDQPCQNPSMEAFFAAEQSDLLKDLQAMPHNAAVRRVNDLVKRTRLARVHALIVSHLREQMPVMWGHEAKQKEMLGDMANIFFTVMKKHHLHKADFPNLRRFQEVAANFEFTKFKNIKPEMIEVAQKAISEEIPALLARISDEATAKAAGQVTGTLSMSGGKIVAAAGGGGGGGGRAESVPLIADAPGAVRAAPSSAAPSASSAVPVPSPAPSSGAGDPFASSGGSGDRGNPFGSDTHDAWSRLVNKSETDKLFADFPGAKESGRIAGSALRDFMLERSGLPGSELSKVWMLSDMDGDGYLDPLEFAVCVYIMDQAKSGSSVPDVLPTEWVPPAKRK